MRQETLILSRQQGGMQTVTNQNGQRLEDCCRGLEPLAGWQVSPPTGEATWQSEVLGEGLGHLGSSGQRSLPVNTESLEYFNKNNVHFAVFWPKICSPRQGWEEHSGSLGPGGSNS